MAVDWLPLQELIPVWWIADPLDVHRVEDRVSTVYIEHSHVDRAENAIVVVNRERTVRVPAAFIGAVLLGPGTRITHGAVRLLADSGTSICWVGEHAVRMYAAGLGPSRGAQLVLRQAYLVTRPAERLRVARTMYGMRFAGEDVTTATMQQLRGREGTRVKRIYREQAERFGVPWTARRYKRDDPESSDEVNRLISMGNSCLYAACHAAIVGVGASPALGFVHTGKSLSFVLDIADLYKAEYTIPLAFELVAEGRVEEADIRYVLRDRFSDGRFMARVVADIRSLLLEGAQEVGEGEVNQLWDEAAPPVTGGQNYASDEAELRVLLDEGYLALSGPEIPPVSEW